MEHQEKKKLSYEELNKVASELQHQGMQVLRENEVLKNELNNQGYILRMEFLFKCLDHNKFFPIDFTNKVSQEIINNLYPKETKKE